RKRINSQTDSEAQNEFFREQATEDVTKTDEVPLQVKKSRNNAPHKPKNKSGANENDIKEKPQEAPIETTSSNTTTQDVERATPQPPRNKNQNKNHKNQNYRDPDYEFEGIIECEGVLEVPKDGGSHGYLRSSDYNYRKSPDDIYISQSQIRLFGLKKGDTIKGIVRPPKGNEQHFPLVRITKI